MNDNRGSEFWPCFHQGRKNRLVEKTRSVMDRMRVEATGTLRAAMRLSGCSVDCVRAPF